MSPDTAPAGPGPTLAATGPTLAATGPTPPARPAPDPADAAAALGQSETRRPGELSDAQYGLLFGLREHSELSSSELACAADLSPASATEMLDALAVAGLVRRVRSDRDRRVVLTSLTERGRALVEARRAHYEPRWRAALAEFSDEELRAAAAVLNRLGEMFDELRDA